MKLRKFREIAENREIAEISGNYGTENTKKFPDVHLGKESATPRVFLMISDKIYTF